MRLVEKSDQGSKTVAAVRQDFRRIETSHTETIATGAELLASIARATNTLGLDGKDALGAILEANAILVQQVEGRARLFELHRSVARIGRRAGLETEAFFGCPDDTDDDLRVFPSLEDEAAPPTAAAA